MDVTGLKTINGSATSLSYEVNFSDASVSIADATVTANPSSFIYDGSPKTPSLTVTYGGKTLQAGVDYTVGQATNNVNAGTASITIYGKGSFKNSKTINYTIGKAQIDSLYFKDPAPPYVYNGQAQKPTVVVYSGSNVVSASEYDVSYSNNVNRGNATVTATAKANGNYTGSASSTFLIYSTVAKPTSKTYTYNGQEQVCIPENAAYEVTGTRAATNAGSYAAIVTLKQGYKWSDGTTEPVNVTWTVARKSIDVPVPQNFTYDGQLHSGVPASSQYSMLGTTAASAAGTHYTTVTPESNYQWSDGTTSSRTLIWYIYSKRVDKPVASNFTYDGKLHQGVPAGDGYVLGVGTISETSVGTYTVNVGLDSYCVWSDGTTGPITLTWRIDPIKISKPSGRNFVYDGYAHTGVAEGVGYLLTGVTTAQSVGTYYAYATPSENYAWTDGSKSAIAIPWSINRQSVTIPATQNFTFDGRPHTGVSTGQGYKLSGDISKINAGTYTVTATLDDYLQWSDGTTDPKTLKWRIDKAKIAKPKGQNFVYDGTRHVGVLSGTGYAVSFTSSAIDAGTYSAYIKPLDNYQWFDGTQDGTWINWSIARKGVKVPTAKSFSYNGSEQTGVVAGEGYMLSGTTSATNPGSYTATATPTSNFRWANGSTSSVALTWKINPISVAKPRAASFTYDGRAHTGVPAGTGYTLSGTASATKVGTYIATATLKAGYRWSDGSSGKVTLTWKINAKPATNKPSTGSGSSGTTKPTTPSPATSTPAAKQVAKVPMHRMYNPNSGEHFYTASGQERDMLVGIGWNYEGVGWFSDDAKGVPLYRQFNPNVVIGTHNYTTSKAENDHLVSIGWRGEGIGWYGVK